MFTLFHLFQLLAVVFGLIIGAIVGKGWFGLVGLFIGAIVGVCIGIFIGRLPMVIAGYWANKEFREKTVPELHQYLRGPVWPAYHMAFAELSRRGEDISALFDVVRGLLVDEDMTKRTHGFSILKAHYPWVAEQIQDYDPNDTVVVCREKISKLT